MLGAYPKRAFPVLQNRPDKVITQAIGVCRIGFVTMEYLPFWVKPMQAPAPGANPYIAVSVLLKCQYSIGLKRGGRLDRADSV